VFYLHKTYTITINQRWNKIWFKKYACNARQVFL